MTSNEDQIQLVRNFQENSVKFLLRNSANAREGLTMMAPGHARLIDFERMTVIPPTFVAPDFRHLETDLLLCAPMRGRRGKGARQVYVYQLFEHQSEPDEHATYRAIRYQMEVFEMQAREWRKANGNVRGFRFDPVLPVVIYTGTRTWDALTPMCDLVQRGELFEDVTPRLEPVFFNLATTAPKKLHDEAGLFGAVLHLMQQRHGKEGDFRALLERVVGQVDRLPNSERGRWHDLLWYFQAMVYHVRERDEHKPLVKFILETERSRSRQKEVLQMGQTMAEVLREEGKLEGKKEGKQEGKQEGLLRQLRNKFSPLPAAIEAEVRATRDDEKLDRWFDEILTADKLADMSFTPGS